MRAPLALVSVALALCVPGAAAGGSAAKKAARLEEAASVVGKLASGELSANAAVNRVTYLDLEDAAVGMMARALSRTSSPPHRGALLQAMALLAKPGQPSEAIFLHELDDEDVANARQAMQGLARMKAKSALPRLQQLLGHKAVGLRLEAARTLGAIGEPKTGAALVKAARAEGELEARAAMLTAAGQVGDRRQQAALEGFLSNSSETTRVAAARGLVLLGTPKGLAFVKQGLAAGDRLERQQAVLLLEGAPANLATPLLTSALEDEDHTVRARAARLLVQLGDRAKLDWLVIESYRTAAGARGPYETELEALRITDQERRAIRVRAGLE